MHDNANQVYSFVNRKIQWLAQTSGAEAKAALAKLRRAIGKSPGSIPDIWGLTLEGLPPELQTKRKEASQAEWAVHMALTLFAYHQQGRDLRQDCMSRIGLGLGSAVRRLIKTEDDESRIKRRFNIAATADSPAELAHHLRGLIGLLKTDGIPLDYPALAADIYRFQFQGARDAVRLNWGREFYSSTELPESETSNNEGEEQ
jgi:CRISPR system Cascade subunit CasB